MTDLYIKESPMRLLMQILKILPNKHATFIFALLHKSLYCIYQYIK